MLPLIFADSATTSPPNPTLITTFNTSSFSALFAQNPPFRAPSCIIITFLHIIVRGIVGHYISLKILPLTFAQTTINQ